MIYEGEKEPTEIIRKYDDKGQKIYYKDDTGCEKTWKYDDQGRQIYYKDETGYEYQHEYNDKGNCTRTKYSNGRVIIREFDNKDNEIYYKEYKPEPLKVEKENTGKESILLIISISLCIIILIITFYEIFIR